MLLCVQVIGPIFHRPPPPSTKQRTHSRLMDERRRVKHCDHPSFAHIPPIGARKGGREWRRVAAGVVDPGATPEEEPEWDGVTEPTTTQVERGIRRAARKATQQREEQDLLAPRELSSPFL